MKLINSFFIIILLLTSCQMENNKTIVEVKKKVIKVEKKIVKVEEKIDDVINVNKLKGEKQKNKNIVFYLVGDPYFIEGVEYFPEENYYYSQNG